MVPTHLENKINSFQLSGDQRCQLAGAPQLWGACGSEATGAGAWGSGLTKWEVLGPVGDAVWRRGQYQRWSSTLAWLLSLNKDLVDVLFVFFSTY